MTTSETGFYISAAGFRKFLRKVVAQAAGDSPCTLRALHVTPSPAAGGKPAENPAKPKQK